MNGPLPDTDSLARGISNAFAETGDASGHVAVLEREPAYPIDWESAALAVGEIDLASLVEGWDADGTAVAVQAYRRARWQTGAPDSFPRTLDVARVYWQLRWLEQGDAFEWRFKELRAAGERLGLI